MLSRSAKSAFYLFAGPLMKANGAFYRVFRAPRHGTIRAHLGPGQRNYIKNWINVDANAFTAKCDVWADIRNPLPFHSGTVSAVYSHHVIEHLPDRVFHLNEVYRVLAPGGVYRVAGPNGDSAVRKFVEGDADWFGDFPESRNSIGGRFENFIFCKGEHVSILLEDFLIEMLSAAGFKKISTERAGLSTGYPELFQDVLSFESESDVDCPYNLVLEARKPVRTE